MFKKREEIEQDFMSFGTSDVSEPQAPQKGILGKLIQLLIVIVLLGILAFMALFGYRYLQNDTSVQKAATVAVAVPVPTPAASAATPEKQKMYTQDEMQEIVKMLMAQMQEMKQNPKKSAGKATALADTKTDANALMQALDTADVDQVEDISDDVTKHTTQEDIYKAKSQKSDKKIDRYNKVVVQRHKNTYDDLSDLSMQIGAVVSKMKKKDKKKSSYTSSIKKEVVTRSNEMRMIVVKSGDTLSSIAKRAYGSAMAYDRILEANPDLVKNPNHIYVGQRLRVPVNKNK